MKPAPARKSGSRAGFTLIEIMVVVAIMGLIVAMGIPSIYHLAHREGITQDVEDLQQACRNARARAIFSGANAELIFHPIDKRYEVSGGSVTAPTTGSSTGLSGRISDSVSLEMLDINLLEYKDSEAPAKVDFHPNGTSDEMTVILHSSQNEWKKITLDNVTGLTSVGPVDQ